MHFSLCHAVSLQANTKAFAAGSGTTLSIDSILVLIRPVVSDSATAWTVALQASLSMGFPRQEYWSVLPFSSPGDLPDAEIESTSPALQVDPLPLNHGGIQRDSMLEYSSKSDGMKEVKV